MENTKYAYASYLFKIRPNKKILPEVLVVYLRSKYGRIEIDKYSMTSNQTNFSPAKFKEIAIPIFSSSFQQQIEHLVKSAHTKLAQSRSLYAEAENDLLNELGFAGWQPQNKQFTVKKFSDFRKSGRLDDEYYQSKYDELFIKLSKLFTKKLKEIVSIKKSIEPGSDCYVKEGIPFIRVSDVNKNGISETELHLSQNDFNLDELRPHKDTILLSKDGSIGIAYKCDKDLDVITSGALLHLEIQNNTIQSDYLTLVLNSIIVQLQAERDSNGAIIKHWKSDDIKNVVIPILPEKVQTSIAEKIQKSFALKDESHQLLETAKHLVEAEIEK